MSDENTAVVEKKSDRSAESTIQQSEGTATAAVEGQQGVQGAAVNDQQSFESFAQNLSNLNPQIEGNNVWVDPKTPELYRNIKGDGGLSLSAPPTDATTQPGAINDAGVQQPTPVVKDSNGMIKTDGTIDVPKERPQGMSQETYDALVKEAKELNDHLTRGNHGLKPEQIADIERSAEQLINGTNPDGSPRRPPLDAAEAAKVLQQTNRMFNQSDVIINQNGFTAEQRNMAATAMIHDVANPNHANQGLNNTCNVTAAAKAEMMTTPGAQTERYVDMFANQNPPDGTGMRYIEMNGRKVYYDKNSIVPDNEARYAADNVGSGARDTYMQGLNHLYVNAVTQQRGEFYTDGRPQFQGDTGERLERGRFGSGDYRMRADGRVENSPAMVAEDVQNIMNQIGAGRMAADYQRFGVGANNGGVLSVEGGNAQSLDAAWQANGGKPMVIAVDTNAAMFRSATDVGGKTAGGGHVVTLVDRRVNQETGQVEYLMHNSWGDQHNGWVSADAIASAMNPNSRHGDKSGTVPPAGSDSGNGGSPHNWSEQSYRRPGGGGGTTAGGDTGGGDAGGGGGSGGSYGQERSPQRDRSGVLTDDDRKAEMDYRQRMKDEEARRKQEEEEREAYKKYLERLRLEAEQQKPKKPGQGG